MMYFLCSHGDVPKFKVSNFYPLMGVVLKGTGKDVVTKDLMWMMKNW
jgi:hypothetical protein